MVGISEIRSVLGSLVEHLEDKRLKEVRAQVMSLVPDPAKEDSQAIAFAVADFLLSMGEVHPQGQNRVSSQTSGEESQQIREVPELLQSDFKSLFHHRVSAMGVKTDTLSYGNIFMG